jgi:hypothetical protein
MIGWALLGSKTHGFAWHRIESLKPYGKAGWIRHVSACGLGIGGKPENVEILARPAGLACPECAGNT